MLINKTLRLALPLACLALAGCRLDFWHKADKAQPGGQVVATVDGQEITQSQLRVEMGGAVNRDPKAQKAAQQAALTAIVRRVALAKAAREQHIDREPAFAMARQRAEEILLVQALEAKIARSVPAPTREEVDQYISEHPGQFAQRKVFSLEQIRIGASNNPKLLDELKPLHNLDDVAALLTRENISFVRGMTTLDSVGQDPSFVDAVAKVPTDDVFLVVDNGALVAGHVRATTIVPLTGDNAVTYATSLLKRTREQEALRRALDGMLTKATGTVQYNKAFAPADTRLGIAPNRAGK